jgi:mannose-1-phosphate guanylyltransferase
VSGAGVPGATRAVLLAAGLGTRLRPLTDATPKCLVDIGGRCLLDYWLEALARAGVHDVLVNTHHLREPVVRFLEQARARHGLRLEEAWEPQLLGSAGTISANAGWVDGAQTALIIYADNLSGVPLRELLAFHATHADPLTMVLFHADEPRRCGIAELDAEGRICAFVEKPEQPRSDLANAGIYALDASAYREIAALGAFDLGFDVLPRFVGRMRGWVFDGYHRDIGTLEALAQARRDVARGFGAAAPAAGVRSA